MDYLLSTAIPFLKGAVARGGTATPMYMFHDGVAYARDAATLAAHPLPHLDGTFGLAASDIEGALGRMAGEPRISAGDGTIVLRRGRLHSSIDLIAIEPPIDGDPTTELAWAQPHAGFLAALSHALPFASREGTWQTGIRVERGRVMAINNRSAIEVTLLEFDPGVALTLPAECVKYVAALDSPNEVALASAAAWLSWPNGAWVRCQALSANWPSELVDKVLDGGEEAMTGAKDVAVTDEWREAFADVAALGEGTATIGPEGIVGRSAHAEHRAEFATGVATETRWAIDALRPVLAVATSWHPDATGPARFSGPNLRGIAMRMRA